MILFYAMRFYASGGKLPDPLTPEPVDDPGSSPEEPVPDAAWPLDDYEF